jgi:hypothetical protein
MACWSTPYVCCIGQSDKLVRGGRIFEPEQQRRQAASPFQIAGAERALVDQMIATYTPTKEGYPQMTQMMK